MPRKRRKKKDAKHAGTVIVNRKDYSVRDYMSPGRLVAWAEWVPEGREGYANKQLNCR